MTEAVKRQLSRWLDTDAIVDGLIDALEQEGIEPTFENAQRLWLDVLQNELADSARRSIRYSPTF